MLLRRIWPWPPALIVSIIKMQLFLQSRQFHPHPHPTPQLAPPLVPSLNQTPARQAVLVTTLCLVLTLAYLDKVSWTGVLGRVQRHLPAPQASSCRAIVPKHAGLRSAFYSTHGCRAPPGVLASTNQTLFIISHLRCVEVCSGSLCVTVCFVVYTLVAVLCQAASYLLSWYSARQVQAKMT